MEKIYIYILAGAGALFVSILCALMLANWHRATIDERKRKREQKRIEKKKWKYAHVTEGNPLLERIIASRFIVFMGSFGTGKSILMNLTSHYIYTKQDNYNHRHRRYNRIMLADYVAEYDRLHTNNKLPIYSNLDFVLTNGKEVKKSQELLPIITLQKRAIYSGVICIDEIASLFPKEMYYEHVSNPDPLVDEMKEFFKKSRHYFNGWLLGTEQDGQDIFVGFRKNGYTLITALGTIVSLSKKGKLKKRWKNFWNAILPACLTLNLKKLWQKQLFLKDKILFSLKILLPAYFFFPKDYYVKKKKITEKINQKYQQYQTHLAFENAEYYIRYTNADIFQYDTRAYKNEYSAKFDKNGNRIEKF